MLQRTVRIETYSLQLFIEPIDEESQISASQTKSVGPAGALGNQQRSLQEKFA